MSDLLLANTSSENYDKDETSYPLGVCYLASTVEAAGFEVSYFDSYREPWIEARKRFEQRLREDRPKAIGFSCLSFNRNSTRDAARISKEILPECLTICGGPHATPMQDQILKNYNIDVVVRGEGEIPLTKIMKSMGSDASLENINGIAFMKNGEILRTPDQDFILELDTIPFPKHDLYSDKIIRENRAFVLTSRGCPGRCYFCASTLQLGNRYRMRAAEKVLEEVKELYGRYKIHYLGLQDDAFTLNKKRALEFCEGLKAMNLPIQWSASTRVNAFDSELSAAMYNSGCRTLAFGVESGSSELLKAMNKNINPEQIVEAYRVANETGFTTGVLLIVGTPGENWRTVKETLGLIRRIKPAEVRSVALLQIFPGTYWYNHCLENKYLSDDYWLSDKPVPYYNFENSELKLILFGFIITFVSKWGISPFRGIKYFFNAAYTYRHRIIASILGKLKSGN